MNSLCAECADCYSSTLRLVPLCCYGSFFNGQFNEMFKNTEHGKVPHMGAHGFHSAELFSTGVSAAAMTAPGWILFVVRGGPAQLGLQAGRRLAPRGRDPTRRRARVRAPPVASLPSLYGSFVSAFIRILNG